MYIYNNLKIQFSFKCMNNDALFRCVNRDCFESKGCTTRPHTLTIPNDAFGGCYIIHKCLIFFFKLSVYNYLSST